MKIIVPELGRVARIYRLHLVRDAHLPVIVTQSCMAKIDRH